MPKNNAIHYSYKDLDNYAKLYGYPLKFENYLRKKYIKRRWKEIEHEGGEKIEVGKNLKKAKGLFNCKKATIERGCQTNVVIPCVIVDFGFFERI